MTMGFKFSSAICSNQLVLLKPHTFPHFPTLFIAKLILTSCCSLPSPRLLPWEILRQQNKHAPSPSTHIYLLAGGRIWIRWVATDLRGQSQCHSGPHWKVVGALEVAQQSLGTCGFQLDRSKVFPLLETLVVWRYVRWWIPGLPVRHLQERKKKVKNKKKVKSWTTAFSLSSHSGYPYRRSLGRLFISGDLLNALKNISAAQDWMG